MFFHFSAVKLQKLCGFFAIFLMFCVINPVFIVAIVHLQYVE